MGFDGASKIGLSHQNITPTPIGVGARGFVAFLQAKKFSLGTRPKPFPLLYGRLNGVPRNMEAGFPHAAHAKC
jgi:hypothetical protein